MNQEDFIRKIIERVRNTSLHSMQLNLGKPSGRSPDKKLVQMSQWFNSLTQKDKDMLSNVMLDTIDEAIFGLLCVIDGARNIGLKGKLELSWALSSEKVRLNNGNTELHALYSGLIQEGRKG